MSYSTDVLSNVIQQSTLAILGNYGLEVEQRPYHHGGGEVEIVAVIGFYGDSIRGSIGLIAGRSVATATYEAVMGSTPNEGQLSDWVGEKVNQILGDFKNQLLSYGAVLHMATPLVLRGIEVRVTSSLDGWFESRAYSSPSGDLCVWIDSQAEPGFELHPVSAQVAEPAESGGAMLMF